MKKSDGHVLNAEAPSVFTKDVASNVEKRNAHFHSARYIALVHVI